MEFSDLRSRPAITSLKVAGGIPAIWLWGVAIASVTAICGIVCVTLYASRLEIASSAQTAASNISEAVAQDENRNIELLDLSLQAVGDGVRDAEVMALPPKLQHQILFDRAATAKDLGALLFLNDEGRIVVDSESDRPRPQKFGDSDFFRVHAHQSNRGLFISRPFLSPFDGDWTIALSRRVDRSDGSFAGVVVGMMKLAYFDTLFRKLNLGSNGAMTLMGMDGTVLMRQPLNEHDLGRVLDIQKLASVLKTAGQESYEAVSRFDGVRRMFHAQRVGELPLVQIVGFAVDDLYAPWWRRATVTVTALSLLCATILGLVAFLQIELRRRSEAEAAYAQLAATDKLTGLPNRRRFDEVLEAEWRRASRSEEMLALLLVDVDHFKAYNDTYGHLGGDAVLAGVGLCLLGALERPGDFAGRYGGEEFVVLLPNTDAHGAVKVAERIRNDVADLREPHLATAEGCVTVSIGIAAMMPRSDLPAADLMTAADLALYRAKNDGRNRAVLCRSGLQRQFAA